MSGVFAENSAIVLNNCSMQNLQNAVRNDGVTHDGKYNNNFNAKTEVNYSQINNTYMSCLYGWCINGVEVYNSRIYNQGGLPIHLADDEGLTQDVPYAYIDKNSVLENYITGSEAWFNIFGFNQMALMMKAGIQNSMSAFNASVIRNMSDSEDEYANMIMVYQPQGIKEYNKKGYGSITKTGGVKTIVAGAYDSTKQDNPGEFAGYVYDTNGEIIGWYYYDGGVTSGKTNDVFDLYGTDPRVVDLNGAKVYAFGQTKAVDTESFGAYAKDQVGTLLYMVNALGKDPSITEEVLNGFVDANNLQNELNTIKYISSHNTDGQLTEPGAGNTILEKLMLKDSEGNLAVQYIMFANSAHINPTYDENGEEIGHDLLMEVVYQFEDSPFYMPMKILMGAGMTDELDSKGAKEWSNVQLEMTEMG